MRATTALIRMPVIKFCGLRTPRDVDAAYDAGATAVGFVLTPSSRRVAPETASKLAAHAPDSIDTVLVADARHLDLPIDQLADLGCDAIQLHYADPSTVAALRRLGVRLILAHRADQWHPEECTDELVLLDSRTAGSGQPWDWARYTLRAPQPWILAGGLTPLTVVEAVRATHPWGVDVSSGIEAYPGGPKSPKLMAQFRESLASLTPSDWGIERASKEKNTCVLTPARR